MAAQFDLVPFLIYFLAFLYWPLLFMRIRDVFSSCELTKKRLLLSVVFAIAAAIPASAFYPVITTIFSLLSIAIAAASIIILWLLPRVPEGSRIKIIILAAYLHVAWQMLPQIAVEPILLDITGDVVVVILAKLSFKAKPKKQRDRKHKQQQQESLSLSELWE